MAGFSDSANLGHVQNMCKSVCTCPQFGHLRFLLQGFLAFVIRATMALMRLGPGPKRLLIIVFNYFYDMYVFFYHIYIYYLLLIVYFVSFKLFVV